MLTPFLGQIPAEAAMNVVRYLSGPSLFRTKEVDRRARDLVKALLEQGAYWKGLGFEKKPIQSELKNAFFWLKRAKRSGGEPTILSFHKCTPPLSWRIIKQLQLVSLRIDLNVAEVAKRAARFGDADLCVKALRENHVVISDCMDEATKFGQHPIIEMLVNEMGATASLPSLRLSIESKQFQVAKQLIIFNPNLLSEITADEAREVLMMAALAGEADFITQLVSLGCLVDARDDWELTALHLAADKGHTDAVKVLVELGCPVDARDITELTALHYAAEKGHTDAIKVLVELGCLVDARDDEKRTALHWAALYGHTDVIKVLVELGCPVDARDDLKRTALHDAVIRGDIPVIEQLVALKRSLFKGTKTTHTPGA